MCYNCNNNDNWDRDPIRCDYDAFSGKYLPRGNSNFVGASMNGFEKANTLPASGGQSRKRKKEDLNCTELSLSFKDSDGQGTFRKLNVDYIECSPVAGDSDDNDNGNGNWVCCRQLGEAVSPRQATVAGEADAVEQNSNAVVNEARPPKMFLRDILR